MTLAELFEMVGGDTTFNVYNYNEWEYLARFDGKNGVGTLVNCEVSYFKAVGKNELDVYIDAPSFEEKAEELKAKGLPIIRKDGKWHTLVEVDYSYLLILEDDFITYGGL